MTQTPWMVYLAAPIDQAGDQTSLMADVRGSLHELLRAYGATVYDPATAWSGVTHPNMGQVNDDALLAADALLAYMPDGIASIGVPTEIERFSMLGRPIAALGGDALIASPVLAAGVRRFDMDDGAGAAVEWLRTKCVGPVKMTPYRIPTSRPTVAYTNDSFLTVMVDEIERAAKLHAHSTPTNTVNQWYAVWAEEVVEAMQAFTTWTQTTWETDSEPLREAARTELVQVAAMTSRLWKALE